MPAYGSTIVKVNSLAATAVLAVGHACNLLAIRGITVQVGVTFIQLFDKATAAEVTVGTTLPDWVVSVPTNTTTGDVGLGDGVPSTAGLKFDNGIVLAATTTPVGSSATASACHVRLAVM